MKLQKYRVYIPDIIKLLLILAMTLPICMACLYIQPAADDFANALYVRNALNDSSVKNFFEAALSQAFSLYKNTSGYFWAVFLNFFFCPLLRYGVIGVRIFCLMTNLLLYLSLYFFVSTVAKNIGKITNNSSKLTIYVLLLFCVTNIYLNKEATFWYCVSVGYVLLVAFMLLGVSTFILAIFTKQKRYLIVAVIMGVLSSGGSLNVAALNCFLYLVIGIYGWLAKRTRLTSVLGFVFPLISGIINLASPGNYIRHDSVVQGYDIIGALMKSMYTVFSRLYAVFSASLLPWILIFLFLYIWLYTKEIKISISPHPVLLGIAECFALTVFAFPVYLGYGGGGLPERCVFIQDIAMYIFLFTLTIYSANWLKNRWADRTEERNRKTHMAYMILVLLTFCMWHSGKALSDAYPSIYLARQLTNGNLALFDEYWTGILREIEASQDDSVIIYRAPNENVNLLTNPGMGADSSYWINMAIAMYYNKQSVTLIVQ